MQQARHTIRELVTLPTPYPGRFSVRYQSGFENLLVDDTAASCNVVNKATIPSTTVRSQRLKADEDFL
jgi:hypothetical protein